jgi:hypothetical protein
MGLFYSQFNNFHVNKYSYINPFLTLCTYRFVASENVDEGRRTRLYFSPQLNAVFPQCVHIISPVVLSKGVHLFCYRVPKQ